ncbi:MAG TPA: BrnA antitoxin family protein [Hyphomicrobiales bacterium]|nr:BrnA antitoxin family protein [Hyphomicrobiales bacterium]
MGESRRGWHSDLQKSDAHRITAAEYEEIPELPEAFYRDGVLMEGGRPARPRGRPRLDRPRELVSLRLDPDVLDHFRAGGPGWRGRINEALKNVVGKGGRSA